MTRVTETRTHKLTKIPSGGMVATVTTPEQIVMATDFSPASSAAISVAGGMAQIFRARVTLLHVFEYAPAHRYTMPVGWMVDLIRRDVLIKLQEVRDTLRKSAVDTDVLLQEGAAPPLQILDFLNRCSRPLLVMGTHAVGGMERFLLGSTAEQVLRQATCPVITVGPHVAKSQRSFTLQTILFATDFSDTSLEAVPFLLELKRASGAHVHVLHVSNGRVSEDMEARSFDRIQKACQPAEDIDYKTISGTDIGHAVVSEAEHSQAELVVLGVRHTSEVAAHLAPKVAFQIIAAAPCAVLTVSS